MLRLITLTTFVTLLLSGCGTDPEIPVNEEALFCDVEEQRKFSQAEIDWRADNAPWNLKRDLKTNKTGERECPDWGEQQA